MRKIALVLPFIILLVLNANSQELEPRALTNLPIGTNFMVVGYGYASGNILFDPSLPLEDSKAQLNTFVVAYVRAINIFGLSGKIDVVLPYGIGEWTGIFTGIDTTTSRSGFGDFRFRISVNFLGAPALKRAEFASYKAEEISGFSLQVIAPTGQYFPDRLINLGSNRWVFKPQWGIAHNFDKWILETYLSTWLFIANPSFWGDNELQQNPLIAVKVHGIRKLKNKMWLAASLGYAYGARSIINDELKDNKLSTIRLGITYAVPIGQHHSLRLVGFSGIRLAQGADFDSVSLLYQYRWNTNI